jgi:glycosyltransferase involved in cell wall biosynthesis
VLKGETEVNLANGTKIIPIKGIGYKKNVSLMRVVDHRIISIKFARLAKQYPVPDVIVAAMPSYDLAYEAIKYGKARNLPVIIDIRDQWPDLFLDVVPPAIRRLVRFALHYEIRIFRQAMKGAASLVSMMNMLLEWGLAHAGRERSWKDKVFYLGQKRIESDVGDMKTSNTVFNRLNGKFVVTFIGTFASYHNPSILVDAAKQLENEDITIVLAGNGELYDEIQNKASILSNVIMPGWLNETEIGALLRKSHVGVCTTPRTAYFFPNKSFLYLSHGLPILSAFRGDLKEIIKKKEIGFYYDPNDVGQLVAHIKKLFNDKVLYKTMARNALEVFDELFDADQIYNAYADHIEAIANSTVAQ